MRRSSGMALALLLAATGFAEAPTTASRDGWRSADGFRGWQVEGEGARLAFDGRAPGSLIAAEPLWEKQGAVSFVVREAYGPWARVELRFRSSGDERSYGALVVEPERGKLLFERRREGRLVAASSHEAAIGRLTRGGAHRLAYRIEGRRVVASLDGREVLTVEGAVRPGRGRVGLAAAFVRVEFSDLAIETAPPEVVESFDSLDGWDVFYGPKAWTTAADASRGGEGNRVAAFSAEADGAILGEQEWTHLAAEVKGRFLDASNTWACFGLRPKVAADRRSFYVVELRGRQHKLVVWKQWEGRRDPAVARDVELPPIEPGRWYTLRCELVGDRITVRLDGQQVVELADPRPIEKGRVAVSASYATVHVDDFRVQELSSDYQFQATAPPPKAYDPGPALPEPSRTGDEDASYWYLASGELRVAVHKTTGMLGGVFLPDGRRLVERALALYRLETRETATDSDAYADSVQALVRRSPRELLLRCANEAMPGVAIEKRYAFEGEGDRLTQAVEFVSRADRRDLFVALAQRTVLDAAFRREAIYTGGSYFGPLIPASSIRERTLTDAHKTPWKRGITNGRPSWILALNHGLDRHIATYRYRVNGQYVLPWNPIWTEELHNLYHTPVGWEMGLCTLHLAPGEKRSVEVHHVAFRGSRLDFYNDYRDLPEVVRMYARVGRRPAWLRDIKLPIYVVNDHNLRLTEEGILLHLRHPFGVWGDLPTSGTVRTAGGIARWPVERVRQRLREVKARSPRIKAGFYTWAWSAHHKSEIVAEHPEWFIAHDKAGEIRNAYPLALSFLRCLAAPGCLEATIQTYRGLVRYYDQDFQYVDNDGTGAQVIDWQHLRVDQDYHWQRLHEGVLVAARARSPETATFFNNRVLPQGDISFAEFMTAEVQNPDDWRRPANEMVPLKVFQKRDPDRVVALLYWRPENDPGYTNYCVGLGLAPWSDRLAKLPFINAAFETRRLELMDAGLLPDWQRDLSTNVEAYALRQGAASFVSLVGHGETPAETQVSFDTKRIGLEPGRPYFAWLFELKDPRDHAGRLTEREQRQAYRASRWAGEIAVAGRLLEVGEHLPSRYERRLTVRPQRLRMLVLTHCPALVWSVNGQRQHFWLPTTRHVEVSGWHSPATGRAEADCRVEAEEAELVIPVPKGRRVDWAMVDGKPVTREPELAGGAWLLRVSLGRGIHRVAVGYKPLRREPELRNVRIEAPERVKAGGFLAVRASFAARDWTPDDGAVLSVSRDGALVASARPTRLTRRSARFELRIPASARPGLYDLAFAVVGAEGAEPLARLEVEPGDWQPTAPPGREHGRPVVKVWDVGRTVKGVEVLRAATDTFDHRGGAQLAELDVDKLTARCGLLDEAESPWGYGFCGIEVKSIKAITLDLRNTFCEPHRDGFELGDRYLDSFAGFIVDYHTAKGYTHRVALGLGVLNQARPVPAPNWGKAARPDQVVAWSRTLLEKPRDTVTVDLAQFAPPEWDGRVWFSIGVDTVYRGLRIEAVVTEATSR